MQIPKKIGIAQQGRLEARVLESGLIIPCENRDGAPVSSSPQQLLQKGIPMNLAECQRADGDKSVQITTGPNCSACHEQTHQSGSIAKKQTQKNKTARLPVLFSRCGLGSSCGRSVWSAAIITTGFLGVRALMGWRDSHVEEFPRMRLLLCRCSAVHRRS